jgi:hypothetical protein
LTLLSLVKQRPFLLILHAGKSKATATNPHENCVGSRGLFLLLTFLGLGKQRPFLLVLQADKSKATAANPHENCVGSHGLFLSSTFLGLGKQRPFLLVSQAGKSELMFHPPLFIVGSTLRGLQPSGCIKGGKHGQ